MAMRGPRHPIGAAPWIAEERATALQIAQSEVEEFSFSAKNEMDWLNEHMAEIFSENQINVADIFKTPGKLRGKTPRTARKTNRGDMRAPLTDIFSSTPKGTPNPFAVSKLSGLQQQQCRQSPTFKVAEDRPTRRSRSPRTSLPKTRPVATATAAAATTAASKKTQQAAKKAAAAATKASKPMKTAAPALSLADSGYHGSQSQDGADSSEEDELAMVSTQPSTQPTQPTRPAATAHAAEKTPKAPATVLAPEVTSPDEIAERHSLKEQTVESSFHSAQEEQTAAAAPEAATSPSAVSMPPSSPVAVVKSAQSPSPHKASAMSPRRKPVPQPSSPLQSTTPACPPPQALLSAMGQAPVAIISSPSHPHLAEVPPAVPTPPVFSAAFADDDEMDLVQPEPEPEIEEEAHDDKENEDGGSPSSEASSPVRQVVRKSSLNFASLPAREPFTSNKSMGGAGRVSRTSHIDPARTSYYNRLTGGKSLGHTQRMAREDDDERDEMDQDDVFTTQHTERDIASHNKTYTQRLQDRISMLGKSQANGPRPSKSLASHLPGTAQNTLAALAQQTQQQPQQRSQHQPAPMSPSPSKPAHHPVAAPGAFPEDDDDDDDDDWILPPPDATTTSPRLNTTKSFTFAKALEESAGGQAEFILPKQRQDASRPGSPQRAPAQAPAIPERTTSVFGHMKSASVPSLPLMDPEMHASSSKKPISVSNPTNSSLESVAEMPGVPSTPSKSPSRNFRDSPLKQVKNKLSSILKSSKGLLASSAAISAEGKSSLLSPSSTRLGNFLGPSAENLLLKSRNGSSADLVYPDLTRQMTAPSALESVFRSRSGQSPVAGASASPESLKRAASPARPNVRKTRASVERERREQKQRDKELKETQRAEEQMSKLEKMREKEREKARVFSEEQEKIAAMEKQLKAAQKEKEQQQQQQQQQKQQQRKQAQKQQDDDLDMTGHPVASPTPSPTRQRQRQQPSSPVRAPPARATRSSPRRVKAQQVEADAEMADAAPQSMPPPPPPPAHGTTSSNSSVPRSTQAGRPIRRPVKPSKDAPSKTKQAPTVIRINTSSSQQQSQFHPSNSVLAATLHETLVGPSHTLKNKASAASLHGKPSLQSLKSSVSSSGRPKALELAAKRKEQEEREAQRKREAKAEMERKRAALQEQEEQRRLELHRQREREAEAAKKAAAAAQRQAAIEKAKQTRAPPPAPRTQLPSGPSEAHGRGETAGSQQPPRPQSRLGTAPGSSAMHRSQEELHRPVNAVLSNTGKAMSKRPLPVGADAYEHGRSMMAGSSSSNNNGVPMYQAKEAKRIRMSEEFDEDELEMGGHIPRASNIKGPPVRPSGGFKKDLPSKSVFGNGYSTAPASSNVSRDLFKATVTAQHNHQTKTGHPLDMAQVSKAAIPFATNSGGGAASGAPNPHKTPARPAGVPFNKSTAKSAAKSSPRFPNGDGIELPEIQTDDEDSEDEGPANVAPWADSPDLRKALMRQETIDPMQVFGPPRPLNMEEVFNKSKERWNKFRARTSSANWSGADRLTEDDVRKDLAARDRIRRDGGWSYDLSRDMM